MGPFWPVFSEAGLKIPGRRAALQVGFMTGF